MYDPLIRSIQGTLHTHNIILCYYAMDATFKIYVFRNNFANPKYLRHRNIKKGIEKNIQKDRLSTPTDNNNNYNNKKTLENSYFFP